MTQNTSTAVMQRRVAGTDTLDYYPTPPWGTRALCEWLQDEIGEQLGGQTVWEPACGDCDMARPLAEYFKWVEASDIADYSTSRGKEQVRVSDFLLEWNHPPHHTNYPRDWIITNPPFQLAEQFATVAIKHATVGVALLVRSAFLESIGRYERLFAPMPPSDILQFTERLVMHHGKLSRNGSTATAYCWLAWRKSRRSMETKFHWLAPCRKRLERDSDYPTEE